MIVRSQARYTKKSSDPTDQDREVEIWKFPTTFIYGFSEKFAFSTTIPYVQKKQESTSGAAVLQ